MIQGVGEEGGGDWGGGESDVDEMKGLTLTLERVEVHTQDDETDCEVVSSEKQDEFDSSTLEVCILKLRGVQMTTATYMQPHRLRRRAHKKMEGTRTSHAL